MANLTGESWSVFEEIVDGAIPNYMPFTKLLEVCLAMNTDLEGMGGLVVALRLYAVADEIKAQDGNAARVRLAYEKLLPKAGFRPPPLPAPIPEKSNEQSNFLRSCGDAEFERGRYREALEHYTNAVSHAPVESEALRLAIGDRSAALLALGERDACLLDIDRALALLHPDEPDEDNFKEKLEKRKEDCLALPVLRRESPALPKETSVDMPCSSAHIALPRETRDDIPCASTAVEIVHSDLFGRSVIAARDIPVGETVALEDPYLVYVKRSERLRRCHHCGQRCDTMLPCDGCSRVMFCDERCRTAAREHIFECPLMAALFEMYFDDYQRAGVQTALRARADHGSWEEFRRAVREIEAVDDPLAKGYVTTRDENGTEKKVYHSMNFASTYTLETNRDTFQGETLLCLCFNAAIILYLLKHHSSFFSDCPEDDISSTDSNFWFTGGLLFHYIMISHNNLQFLHCTADSMTYVSGGMYPFSSLMNHSCAPNILGVTVGTKLALVALRPIKKGQQLFSNYGAHHATQTKATRQEYLEGQFKFTCRCEACTQNWPLSNNRRNPKFRNDSLKKIVRFLNSNISDQLKMGNKKFAGSILNKLYQNVSALEPYYPCTAIDRYQVLIKMCWMLCGNIVTSD